MRSVIIILLFTVVALRGIAQQAWTIDPSSTRIGFTIKNFGKNVDGSFSGYSGIILFDPQHPGQGSFDVTVDVKTIDTGIKKRDNHLRSADYFEVEKYPSMHFRSSKITRAGNGYVATGDLTIKDKTQQVDIPFTFEPSDKGGVFKGSFKLDRTSYGVGGKSSIMGETVTVNLEVSVAK